MRIVENTRDRLVIRSTPWVLGVAFIVAILISLWFGMRAIGSGDLSEIFWGLIGLPAFLALFLVIFVRRDEVILDRRNNLLEMRHRTYLRQTRVTQDLATLERAIVETSNSGDGGPTHRPTLVLKGPSAQDRLPITPVYSSGKGADHAVTAINNWLEADIDSAPPTA